LIASYRFFFFFFFFYLKTSLSDFFPQHFLRVSHFTCSFNDEENTWIDFCGACLLTVLDGIKDMVNLIEEYIQPETYLFISPTKLSSSVISELICSIFNYIRSLYLNSTPCTAHLQFIVVKNNLIVEHKKYNWYQRKENRSEYEYRIRSIRQFFRWFAAESNPEGEKSQRVALYLRFNV
jgi:hypothetical protein